MHPAQGGRAFSQRFQHAYATRNVDGMFEFVLVDETKPAKAAKPSQALTPASSEPLRQIVYVKVLWLPMRGNVNDTAVSNASIDWYITGESTDQPRVLKYSGAAYVLADEGSNLTTMTVRSAKLKPQVVQGLVDPLGPFSLTGSV